MQDVVDIFTEQVPHILSDFLWTVQCGRSNIECQFVAFTLKDFACLYFQSYITFIVHA